MTADPGLPGRSVAILIKNLDGGGVQKMRLALAGAFHAKGYHVELVVMEPTGALLGNVPQGITVRVLKRSTPLAWRLKALRAGWIGLEFAARTLRRRVPGNALAYLPALVDYLERTRPDALLAATPYINLTALLARRIASVQTRILVSEHNDLRHGHALGRGPELRRLVALMRLYREAEMIVGVSAGVTSDIARRSGLPEDRISTIHNPAVGLDLVALSQEPTDNSWFAPGAPPVILAVGQLSERKDYPTVIRALKWVRESRDARLVIMGKSHNPQRTEQEQQKLIDLAASLGIGEAVQTIGFEVNPYRFMARAAVLVLSSRHEGFANVLPEALACGCPVVSTDCPSGPAEILDCGRYGALVPVGDDRAMANAILATLDKPLPEALLRQRGMDFSVDRAAALYERIFTQERPAAAVT